MFGCGLGGRQQDRERLHDFRNHLVHEREHAGEIAVGPEMHTPLGLDQLNVDADAVDRATHAALDNETHTQIPPNGANIDRTPLIGKRGMP
jgi:hypothetical protein